MNLVIDDAVEVKLATKTDAESRTQLGMILLPTMLAISNEARPNSTQG